MFGRKPIRTYGDEVLLLSYLLAFFLARTNGAACDPRFPSPPVFFFVASSRHLRGVCLVKAGAFQEAEDAFSKAVDGQKQAAVVDDERPAVEGTSNNGEDMRAAFYRERGKVRQILRDFAGAR